jgi:hypothetical protein
MAAAATARTRRRSAGADLTQEELATLRIEDERHALIWIHDAERAVSVLVDRPLEGSDTVRVVGLLAPEEGRAALAALIEDYRRSRCAPPAGRCPRPRALEPGDLSPPPGTGRDG